MSILCPPSTLLLIYTTTPTTMTRMKSRKRFCTTLPHHSRPIKSTHRKSRKDFVPYRTTWHPKDPLFRFCVLLCGFGPGVRASPTLQLSRYVFQLMVLVFRCPSVEIPHVLWSFLFLSCLFLRWVFWFLRFVEGHVCCQSAGLEAVGCIGVLLSLSLSLPMYMP